MTVRILTGDCRDVLKTLADCSVDSVVCDPPYELTSKRPGGRSPATEGKVMKGFMGMAWDGSGVAFDSAMWAECLRVLKPGGHLLAFGGTRTQHRMVCAIEDAGFEIRDQAIWAYASGFPKNLDVSKAIDKAAGAERIVTRAATAEYRPGTNVDWDARGSEQREQPATAEAAAWKGWGTALKPAWEPICVARKPLIGTVAANILKHGTGALNIDACRVDGGARPWRIADGGRDAVNAYSDGLGGSRAVEDTTQGRWPANLLHDGSAEVVALFPDSNGQQGFVGERNGDRPSINTFGDYGPRPDTPPRGDTGSAARFFWCPKTSKADRNEGLEGLEGLVTDDGRKVPADNAFQRGKTLRQNFHPTVKPTDLMRYLCRLITPPGGTVLDPFAGSGSTLKAAELEGFNAIGIELDPAYVEIARRRISSDAPLFAEVTA